MVKSALRVMEIFELFAEERRRLGVAEVVDALGYPQSSTSVLLHSLTKLGYLTFDRNARTFIPTLRIASIGSWLLANPGAKMSPLQVMEHIAKACGHTVVLGVQHATQVVYLQVVQATNALRFNMRPGSFRPICTTATGLILLSQKSDADVKAIVRRFNAEKEQLGSPIKLAGVLEAVADARRDGYIMTLGTATPGAAVIAMPYPPHPDQPQMAIGIGMAIEDAKKNQDKYLTLLSRSIGQA